ncbi:MAG: hypothetical protein AAF585_16765 [Verrucomicrobiota bacterium]
MKARFLLIPAMILSLSTLNAGVPDDGPLFPEETPDIPISEIHDQTLQSFIHANGFGRSRKINLPTGPANNAHYFTNFVTGDEGYRVALVGLVKTKEGQVYPAAADVKNQTEEERRKHLQRLLTQSLDQGFDEASQDPPDRLDKRAIAIFRDAEPSGKEDEPLIGKVDGKWFAHGSIRAQASCAKCHEVEEGTLLGLFRYEFSEETQ